jgi:hypothetical protein
MDQAKFSQGDIFGNRDASLVSMVQQPPRKTLLQSPGQVIITLDSQEKASALKRESRYGSTLHAN